HVLLCAPILARLTSLAAKGYSEVVGFLALIAGACLFLNAARASTAAAPVSTAASRAGVLWASFALVSLGAWIRPNFALVVGVLGLIYLRELGPAFRWRTSVVILSGSLLVFAVVLHNLYFSGRLIWFTITVKGDSLRVDLADYAAMLGEWSRATIGEYSMRVGHQLYG